MVSGLRPSTPTVTTTVSPSSRIRARSPDAKASDISAGLWVRLRSTTSSAPVPAGQPGRRREQPGAEAAALPAVLDEQGHLCDAGLARPRSRRSPTTSSPTAGDQRTAAGEQQPPGEPLVERASGVA